MSNGYLSTKIDWIPGLANGFSLKDFPSFIRTTDPDDIMLNYFLHETRRAFLADAILINTFEPLETPSLNSLRKILPPPIHAVGPLSLLSHLTIPKDTPLSSLTPSLWKEDTTCLDWLDAKSPDSVVYVNFGSITVMTSEQLAEFAWGLANSGYDFVWIVRPDLVRGESVALPGEFAGEVEGRGMMASWCVQEEVLAHSAVGVFLTHCGWNSTLESLCGGVAMICWPFFAEQQTNCRYVCGEWGVGVEMEGEVKREEVEGLIREMMGGESGRRMREKGRQWKERAGEAVGSSAVNLDRMLNEVLGGN